MQMFHENKKLFLLYDMRLMFDSCKTLYVMKMFFDN